MSAGERNSYFGQWLGATMGTVRTWNANSVVSVVGGKAHSEHSNPTLVPPNNTVHVPKQFCNPVGHVPVAAVSSSSSFEVSPLRTEDEAKRCELAPMMCMCQPECAPVSACHSADWLFKYGQACTVTPGVTYT